MTRVIGWGLFLTAVVTTIAWMVWGRSALVASVVFGVLATAIQATAIWKLKPVLGRPLVDLIRGWALGVGLRLLGVALIAVAVVLDRQLFPPLAAAIAYLGVLVPLLFGEIYLIK